MISANRFLPLALFVALVMPALANAQAFAVGGPAASVLFDARSRSIRRLIGVPGAAHYGPPLVTNADRGFPSPDGTVAILVTGSKAKLTDFQGTPSDIAELMSGTEVAVWTADSSRAFLFDSSTSRLQGVTRSPGGWNASAEIDVSVYGSGGALIGAISYCSCALLTFPDPPIGHIQIIGIDGAAKPVLDVDAQSLLTVDSSDRLYVVSASQIQRVNLKDSVPSTETVLRDPALASPAAICVSGNGNTLLVATPDQKLSMYDLAQRQLLATLDLSFQATVVRKLDGSGKYYSLNEPLDRSQPFYVLALGETSNVFFIPAVEF